MKSFITLALFFCTLLGIHAQEFKHFTPYDHAFTGIVPSTKPAYDASYPTWATMLYQYPVNAAEVKRLFTAYMLEHPGEHSAIIRYCKQWLRAVEEYTDDTGAIILPKQTSKEEKKYAEGPLANTSNWTFWGPKETFWLNESGSTTPPNAVPWQANIYAFDVSVSNNSILYAGTETGFVNKTTDKGISWKLLGQNYYFGGGIIAIAIHPVNPDIVYVSGGRQIHKSTDGGISWKAMLSTQFSADRLRIDPNNPAIIYAASPDGLFRSDNQGVSWTNVWNAPCYDIELQSNNSSVVFALGKVNGNFQVMQSNDAGLTFTPQTTFPSTIIDKSGGLLAVTKANPSLLYAVLLSENEIPQIMKGSMNGNGMSWQTMSKGKTTDMPMDNWQGYYDLVCEVSPNDSNLVFVGTASLFKSTNGGKTFSIVGGYGGNFPIHPDQQDMKMLPNGETWISTDGGLTLTTDNFTNTAKATARNNGIVGSDFWGFDQGWNEDIVVGGRYHNGNTAIADFYQPKALRMGGGESPTGWILHGKERHVAFNDLGNGWILPKTATGQPEGRFAFSKFPNMEEYGGRRGNLLHHPQYSNQLFVGEGKGFWQSLDGGESWDLIHAFENAVRFIQISYKEQQPIIYVDIVNEGLYKSTDLGKTWTAKPALYAAPNGTNNWKGRTHISVSPTNGNTLYATFSNGTWSADIGKVFMSTDGGDSWKDFTGTISEYLKCTIVQPSANGEDIVYVFTNAKNAKSGKVFYRTPSMNDWSLYAENYPAGMSVNLALPFFRDGKLRVAGNGSVWESPMIDTSYTPIAKAWVSNAIVECYSDTISLMDHSLMMGNGVERTWTITPTPEWISDIHAKNPQVVLGAKGAYAVQLMVKKNGKEYASDIVNIDARRCPSIETCDNPGLLPKTDWMLLSYDSEEKNYPGLASMAIDDDPNTIWHTRWSTGTDSLPHEMRIDFGFDYKVYALAYQGRADGINGRVKECEFYITTDTNKWGQPIKASFENNSAIQWIKLDTAGIPARFMKFRATKEVNGNPWTTVAEFYVRGCIPGQISNVQEIQKEPLFSYPNPTLGMVIVPLSKSIIKHIRIVDITGKMHNDFTVETDDQEIRLDVRRLQIGVYTVLIQSLDGTQFRTTFVKH